MDEDGQLGYGKSKDQDRLLLLNLLLAGAASAPTAPADASYFECLRDWVRNDAFWKNAVRNPFYKPTKNDSDG